MKKRSILTHFMRRCLPVLLALLLAAAGVAEGAELLTNGDFSQPLNWQLYTESGGAAQLSVVDGELVVDVEDIGRVGHAIQPYYDGFALTEGVVYTLSYDVRGSVPRELYVRIQLNGGDYHAYFEELIQVTEAMEHHESTFTMEEPTDRTPRLCVNMGYGDAQTEAGVDPETLNGSQVVFDNFSLTVADDTQAVAEEEDADATGIRVNQLGFMPTASKVAVFAGLDDTGDSFRVVDTATGETAFEGSLSAPVENAAAGETDRVADFSALAVPGTYQVESDNGVLSPKFTIGEGVYDDLLRSAVRMLYLQRCGMMLKTRYAHKYAHPECHTALATIYGTDEQIDVSGGWHDAGDYGRYVVSGAKAAADLLLAHEARGAVVDDCGIPESGDGVDDLLQEAKYELDWLLKMQREDGGVYHKVTCRNFPAFVEPQEETDELIVCPVSNTATGDFAGVMALAARLCADQWPEDAAAYLDAATRAWTYLEAHRGDPAFKNPEDVVTGEYSDEHDEDEIFWAAAELAKTTGEDAYREAASELMATGGKLPGLGWVNMGTYGLLAILSDGGYAEDDPLYVAAKEELQATVDEALALIRANPYGADRAMDYEWGSNMGIANTGSILALSANLLGDEGLRAAAQHSLDYLLGRNATGYCFVTGYGAKSPKNPHHRPSVAKKAPMPGMLVGGPDNGLEDPAAKAILAEAPPAKCYVDTDQSYSTNEVCVYWNSPLVLLLAGM